ncbi:hypothetical protein WJX77_006428 [Trebouxia sp. C0004]
MRPAFKTALDVPLQQFVTLSAFVMHNLGCLGTRGYDSSCDKLRAVASHIGWSEAPFFQVAPTTNID